MDEQTQTLPLPEVDSAAELPDFEEFSRRAIRLGFTVHLMHYRFHPGHTLWAPQCQSRVQLSIIPILDDTKARFGSPCGGFRDVHGDTIAAVLANGRMLLDRYESGENLAGLDRYKSEPDARSPRRQNLSDEERERRSQRMRDYWAKKRADAAAVTADET